MSFCGQDDEGGFHQSLESYEKRQKEIDEKRQREIEETSTKAELVEQVRKSLKRKREDRTKKEMDKIAKWEQKAIQKARDKVEVEIRLIKGQAGRKRAKLDWQNYGDVDDPDNTLCLYSEEELKRMLD